MLPTHLLTNTIIILYNCIYNAVFSKKIWGDADKLSEYIDFCNALLYN